MNWVMGLHKKPASKSNKLYLIILWAGFFEG